MKTIIAMRHGEKKGDALTPNGAAQCFAMAMKLRELYDIKRVHYSGANRAREAGQVVAGGLGVNTGVDLWSAWYPTSAMDGIFATEAEMIQAWSTMGAGTVQEMLDRNEFFRRGRQILQANLVTEANAMCTLYETATLVVSHSGWLELATLDTSWKFEDVPLAAAVIYTVEYDRITSTEMILPPPFPA